MSQRAPDIRPADFEDPQLLALLRLHLGEALANSPPGTSYALDLSGLQNPSVSLYALWIGDVPAGMGALQELAPDWGELKSMRTAPAFLRQGLASVMLAHLIGEARSRGYRRLSLETGTGVEYGPAVALYTRHGFVPGDIYGSYQASPHNQYFHLDLTT